MLTISLASRQNKRTGARENKRKRTERERETCASTHTQTYIHERARVQAQGKRDEEIKFCANPLPKGEGAQSTQNVTCL